MKNEIQDVARPLPSETGRFRLFKSNMLPTTQLNVGRFSWVQFHNRAHSGYIQVCLFRNSSAAVVAETRISQRSEKHGQFSWFDPNLICFTPRLSNQNGARQSSGLLAGLANLDLAQKPSNSYKYPWVSPAHLRNLYHKMGGSSVVRILEITWFIDRAN